MNISIKPVNIKKRKEKGSINYKSNIKNKIKLQIHNIKYINCLNITHS
jgi:hypothetical protein